MEIKIVVVAGDPADEDDGGRSGLTEQASRRLENALRDAGFEIADGPVREDV